MYISSCRHKLQISTVQSEEQHVMNRLSKFHLNQRLTNRATQFYENCANQKKSVAPSAQKIKAWRLAVSKLRPTVPTTRKVQKIAFLYSIRIAWRSHPCRQVVHHKRPRIRLIFMRRLVAHSKL